VWPAGHRDGIATDWEQHREPVPQPLPVQTWGLWAGRRRAKALTSKGLGSRPRPSATEGALCGCRRDCYNPTEAGSSEAGSIEPERRVRAELWLPLKPVLLSASGGRHVMTLISSH